MSPVQQVLRRSLNKHLTATFQPDTLSTPKPNKEFVVNTIVMKAHYKDEIWMGEYPSTEEGVLELRRAILAELPIGAKDTDIFVVIPGGKA
jgi:hypothetical protein